MLKIAELGIETKTGLFFAITAFMLSFLTGFISGINFSVVIVRSSVTAIVFTGIGFVVISIIKKYVPEFYEFLANVGISEEVEAPVMETGGDQYGDGSEEIRGNESDESGFTGFDENSYERLSSVSDQGLNSELNIAGGKMGKHIIVNDHFSGYEPKIIAEAVRTMMSKDKE